MLNRRYNVVQWAALSFLGLGVACIQLEKRSASPGAEDGSQLQGLLAVLTSCFCSAIAATYFELVVKSKPATTEQPSIPLVPPSSSSSRQGSPSSSATLSEIVGSKAPDRRRDSIANDVEQQQEPYPTSSSAKSSPLVNSLWARNIQLSLFSLLFGLPYSWYKSTLDRGRSGGYFASFLAGFNAFTWAVIVIQSVGGLLTGECPGADQVLTTGHENAH